MRWRCTPCQTHWCWQMLRPQPSLSSTRAPASTRCAGLGGQLAAGLCLAAVAGGQVWWRGVSGCWTRQQLVQYSQLAASASAASDACSLQPALLLRLSPSQGSLAAGTFAAYSPVTREAEVCDVAPAAGEEEEEEDVGAGSEEDMVVEEAAAVAEDEVDVAAARDVVGDLEI